MSEGFGYVIAVIILLVLAALCSDPDAFLAGYTSTYIATGIIK